MKIYMNFSEPPMENMTLSYTNYSITDTTIMSYSNKTLQEYNDEEANRRLIPVIYLGLLMLIGIPGNLIVLIVYPSRFPKTTHRMFITGLAVADILVCVVTLPFEITEMRLQYTFYNSWCCKFFRACNSLFALSSIFILMGLSGDRFRRVCTPLKVQMTSRHATIYIMFCVVLAVIFSWPNLFISGIRLVNLGNNVTGYDCSLSDQFAKTKYPTLYGGTLFLVFIICMIILIVLYFLIGRQILKHFQFRRRFSRSSTSMSTSSTPVSNDSQKLMSANKAEQEYNNEVFIDNKPTETQEMLTRKSHRKSSKHHSTKHQSVKEDAGSNKLTKIALAISLAFILSYLPHLTISLLTALKGKFLLPPGPVVSAVLPIVTRSFAINNVVNPIIYGLMDKRFRDNCKLMFKNALCCK